MGRLVFLTSERKMVPRHTYFTVELPWSLKETEPRNIMELTSLQWAAVIMTEIDEYAMNRKRTMRHLSPETWRTKKAKQGACIAQQIYAIEQGLI